MKKHLLSVAVCLAGSLLLASCGSSSSSAPDAPAQQKTTRGVIDGFGSVIVNGVHYNTNRSQFNIDSRDGSQADLRVGQVVTIVGSQNGSEGVAATITYDVSVEGTVTAVDAVAGTITVLGQTISTNALTMFEDIALATLAIGTRVEVSGYSIGAGQILASFISLDDDDHDGEELTGVISELDETAKTFTIGTQVISYAAATLDLDGNEFANGLLVEVEGDVLEGVLVATKIDAEDSDFDIDDEVEVEGFVSAINATENTFFLNGLMVRFNDDTEFDDGELVDLVDGAFVEVEGTIAKDGSLVAEEIEFSNAAKIELQGVVESTTATTLTVMGVTINIDLRTRVRDDRDHDRFFNLAKLNSGDYVELLIEEVAAGQYRAQLMERVITVASVSIEAPVTAIDRAAGTITVLGKTLTVESSFSAFISALSVGADVEIKGTYDGQTLTITTLKLDD